MIQQSHSWAYIQTKLQFKNIHAPHVHRSTIYNNQAMETNNHQQMNKEDVVTRGSQGLRSPLESPRGALGAP